jgi:hypothetical protein
MPPKKGTFIPNKTSAILLGLFMKYEIQEMEAKLEAKMDGLKEDIMEVLKNFVIEKTPESENASHEIHDVDTRKVNQEWRNSNFGLNTNHVPKIDMRKFDGKDQSHGYFRWSNSLIFIMFHIHKRYQFLLYI